MSKQEKASWVLLAVNLVVGIWYVSAMFTMGADTPLHAPQMAQLIVRITIVAILVAITGKLVMHFIGGSVKDAVELDERDQIISLKASRNGYWILLGAVIALIVALVTALGMSSRVSWGETPAVVLSFLHKAGGPSFIANLLLFALLLTECVIQSSRIYFYRRGY